MSSNAGSSRRAARAKKRATPPKSSTPAPRRQRAKFVFDQPTADRACEFFELFLHHSKGEWAGQPFRLQAWQAKIVRNLFGWKRRDGTRRYRTGYLRIPRKNGKSTLAAGVGLYLMLGDNEPGAEVYGAANDKEQASITFREASRMVKASPELSEMCHVMTKSMVCPMQMSTFQALSSDAGNKDGLNTHGLLLDELHEFRDRLLYEKLDTSRGARRQPLTFITTTAGVGRHTLYAELDQHAQAVAAGDVDDESFYPVLFGAAPGDDWHDEKVWAKANPNLGVSVKLDYLRDEHRKAVLMPGRINSFLRYHLNIDTEQDVRWLSLDAWDACTGEVALDQLAGAECYAALDLSRRTDITAGVRVFPKGEMYLVVPRFWIPAEGLAERERRDKVPYTRWVEQGLIVATPGNVIDYSYPRAEVRQWAKDHDLRELAYDPYGATQLALELQDDGINCFEHRQGFISMSEPSKKLEEVVLKKQLAHAANPVLRWMAGNVAIEMDAAENIKPSKRKSTQRIDGIVALVMALGRASLRPDTTSAYENRGIVLL